MHARACPLERLRAPPACRPSPAPYVGWVRWRHIEVVNRREPRAVRRAQIHQVGIIYLARRKERIAVPVLYIVLRSVDDPASKILVLLLFPLQEREQVLEAMRVSLVGGSAH